MTLGISRWRDLKRWIPNGGLAPEFQFQSVPLRELLEPRRELIAAKDFANATPITIHFDGTIERRDRATPFQGKMFAAYPGDLLYSKIDLRNGAICAIPPTFSRVVVTTEFPVYKPDKHQVDPAYLALVLRSPNFLASIRSLASGTSGRKRIDSDAFESIAIPLPDLSRQKEFALLSQQAYASSEKLLTAAREVETIARANFETSLGLKPPKDLPQVIVQIGRYSDVNRWSHESILYEKGAQSRVASQQHSYAMLEDLVEDLTNGWSPQCLSTPAKSGEWGVIKVGAVSSGRYNEQENKALPNNLQERPRLEIKGGDVLVGRANVRRLVGAAAYVHETRQKLLLCDKIFRVAFRKDSPIDPRYLVEVFGTMALREQIEAALTGTSPTMKNISKASLLALMIPLPAGDNSLSAQKSLVANLDDARKEAELLRAQASQLLSLRGTEFLNAVFG